MKNFHIPDMSCGHCKATVEKTNHVLDPAARIELDMTARKISLNSGAEARRRGGGTGQTKDRGRATIDVDHADFQVS